MGSCRQGKAPSFEEMKNSVKIELLAQAPLFAGLPVERLRELCDIARVIRVKKGEILFSVDEPASRLFLIASGQIRAYRVNPAGREQTIHVETRGATLAEVALFDDGPYPATAAAEMDSVLLALERESLKAFCLRHPEVAWSALRLLAGRLRRHAELIDQLSLQEVGPRLVRFLLREAEESGQTIAEGMSIAISLSHQQLATRIGSVREVVSRSLNRLERDGLISIEGRQTGSKGYVVRIKDQAELKALAERSA